MIIDVTSKDQPLLDQEFVQPLARIAGEFDDVRIMHYSDPVEGSLDEAERILISGTALKDTNYLNELDRFQWLKSFERPVLGICAGMQIIGLIHDCMMIKSTEIGMIDVECVQENPLFRKDFKAYELHNLAIEASEEFTILARSGSCVQAFKHKEKQMYGSLFHPEVRNTQMIRDFMRIR